MRTRDYPCFLATRQCRRSSGRSALLSFCWLCANFLPPALGAIIPLVAAGNEVCQSAIILAAIRGPDLGDACQLRNCFVDRGTHPQAAIGRQNITAERHPEFILKVSFGEKVSPNESNRVVDRQI